MGYSTSPFKHRWLLFYALVTMLSSIITARVVHAKSAPHKVKAALAGPKVGDKVLLNHQHSGREVSGTVIAVEHDGPKGAQWKGETCPTIRHDAHPEKVNACVPYADPPSKDGDSWRWPHPGVTEIHCRPFGDGVTGVLTCY